MNDFVKIHEDAKKLAEDSTFANVRDVLYDALFDTRGLYVLRRILYTLIFDSEEGASFWHLRLFFEALEFSEKCVVENVSRDDVRNVCLLFGPSSEEQRTTKARNTKIVKFTRGVDEVRLFGFRFFLRFSFFTDVRDDAGMEQFGSHFKH